MGKGLTATFILLLVSLIVVSAVGYSYFSSYGKLFYLNGGGGGGGGGSSSPYFTINSFPSTGYMGPSQSISFYVVLLSVNGFSGYVSLTSSNCPLKATCSFSSSNVYVPSGSSAVSVHTIAAYQNGGYTVIPEGSYTIIFTGKSGAVNYTKSVLLKVEQLKILTQSPLPSATVGKPYRVDLRASGGMPPYKWTGTGGFWGAWPGFTLYTNGTLYSASVQNYCYCCLACIPDPSYPQTGGFQASVTDSYTGFIKTSLVQTFSITFNKP